MDVTPQDHAKAANGKIETGQDDKSDLDEDLGPFGRFVENIENAVGRLNARWGPTFWSLVKAAIFVAFLVYVVYALQREFEGEDSFMLIGLAMIFTGIVINKQMKSRNINVSLPPGFYEAISTPAAKRIRRVVRYLLYVTAVGAIGSFLYFNVLQKDPQNLHSLFGMVGLILICFVYSVKPSRVNWHPVFWGLVIQFVFATLTLRTEIGYNIFEWLGDSVQTFTHYSDAGAAFVLGENFRNMGLAFSISSIIVFFNAAIFLMNHVGITEFIVVKMGTALSLCLETGPVESVIAAANIFIGLAEAPLLIRPYLVTLSHSELHAVMCCGFASIAGGIMGAFIRFGAPANHLLTAAVISAPSALAVSKLVYPELEKVDFSKQKGVKMRESGPGRSALSACAEGAIMSIMIIGSIMANMIFFYSALEMMNSVLKWFGERAGYSGLTFELVSSYVLFPISFLMGTETGDCGRMGALIGTKLFATPMVAYAQLGQMIENRGELEAYTLATNGSWHWEGLDVVLDGVNKTLEYGVMSHRSEIIATYALCGFSAVTAIGICLGTLITMCPSRRTEIVELVTRAFLAGNMASFLTGAVAGVMYTSP